MFDKLLITKEDVGKFRPIAEGMDDMRIEPFITESQQTDLKPVLNDALHYDFLSKFDQVNDAMYAKYQKLLNGGTYTMRNATISYEGIKPMLVYFVLAKFIMANPINITRFGLRIDLGDTSRGGGSLDSRIIDREVNSLKSTAASYQGEVIKFLRNNTKDYPLYAFDRSNQTVNRTGFNFFKV